jgi:lysozyme
MNKGIPIIRKYEGLKLNAYECPASVPLPPSRKFWTIGYGSTFYENGSRVQQGDKITLDRADRLLFHTVGKFEAQVRNLVKSQLNDNQFGALTSFAFNVGAGALQKSTLLKKVNANPNDQTIRAEFMRWNRAGGRVLNGLTRRRQEEADLYFQPVV